MKTFWDDSIHGHREIAPMEVTIDGLEMHTFSGFSGHGEAVLTPWPLSIRMVTKPCGIDFERLRYMPVLGQESIPGALELPEVVGYWKHGEGVVAHQKGLLLDDVYIESVSHLEDGSTVIKMTAAYPQPTAQ